MSALEVEDVPLFKDASAEFERKFPWAVELAGTAAHLERADVIGDAYGVRDLITFVPLGCTIQELRVCALISMLTQVGVLVLTYKTSSCDEESGTAHYPSWIWASLLPVLVFKAHTE